MNSHTPLLKNTGPGEVTLIKTINTINSGDKIMIPAKLKRKSIVRFPYFEYIKTLSHIHRENFSTYKSIP